MPVMASQDQTAGVTEPKATTNSTVWKAQSEVGEIYFPTHHAPMNDCTTTKHDMQHQPQPRCILLLPKHTFQQPMQPTHLDRICQTGSRPDDRLELVKAGDVEVNPGPDEEETRCYECDKKLSRNYLTCSRCSTTSHKHEACSGLKPSQS